MQKRHQINIITAQPNENGFRAKTTKSFILGKEDKSYFPKYWKQKIIEWDDLEELYKTLEPYLKGTHPVKHIIHALCMVNSYQEQKTYTETEDKT